MERIDGNGVSRRWFIGGLGSLGALGGCRAFCAPTGQCVSGRPNLVFGVVSDVHMRIAADGNGLAAGYDTQTLEHALSWFRDQGVDAVMIPGDLADSGLLPELEAVAAAWFKVFPNDRAPDGRHVERLFVYGNHDWNGWVYSKRAETIFTNEAERRRNMVGLDQKGNWERVFHEPFSLVWRKEVKGYSFVGAHWTKEHCIGSSLADEKGIQGVREFFAQTAAFDPSRPFFYFQHPHLKNTCYGPWAWGHDNGEAPQVLSAYPNAVAISGHSHYTLTDERSIWQGAFTALGASSLRYTGLPYNSCPPAGYENTIAPKPWRTEVDPYKAMPALGAGSTQDGRQGMLVRVYDDRIVFVRREFVYDQSLGDDWVVPLAAAAPRPFDFAVRATQVPAPAFPPDATLSVRKVRGKIRGGKGVKGAVPSAETDVYELSFPGANARKGARVLEYVIRIEGKDGSRVEKRLLAEDFHLPASRLDAKAACTCRIAAAQLPAGASHVFSVLPVGSLGRLGTALSARAEFCATRCMVAKPL